MNQAQEQITMADLRQACESRIDRALSTTEAGVTVRRMPSGLEVQNFETAAGLTIHRYGGLLAINCDFSELGDDEPIREVRVEFYNDSDELAATETTSSEGGYTDKTIPKSRYNQLAAELIKYVNLEI